MNLAAALHLEAGTRLAAVGAGGKTTLLFQLARQAGGTVWITTTTHFGVDQIQLADRSMVVTDWVVAQQQPALQEPGVVLILGPEQRQGKVTGPGAEILDQIQVEAVRRGIPLLIEADGSRSLPVKAPAEHEPAIPAWVDKVVVVAGLSALGQPLAEHVVHRPVQFGHLAGLDLGEPVREQALQIVLTHSQGGLKGIPPQARRTVLLNQADRLDELVRGEVLAASLVPPYQAAVLASLGTRPGEVLARYEQTAGVILAAGGSQRLGRPKQLLEWQGEPLVRRAVRSAVAGGLDPVIVVVGAHSHDVARAVADLPVQVVENPGWQGGQSTSIQAGLRALPTEVGAVVFLTCDQPFLEANVIQALRAAKAHSTAQVIAPMVAGQRGSPVLFDRATFDALSQISGDQGGRAIFAQFPPQPLPWADERLLLDIDTPEDVLALRSGGRL